MAIRRWNQSLARVQELFEMLPVSFSSSDNPKNNNNNITTTSEVVKTKRTLVVYSGPASSQEGRVDLYQRNLEYFLLHGGIVLDDDDDDCLSETRPARPSEAIMPQQQTTKFHHDTIIVVGHDFYHHYHDMIERWKEDHATSRNRSFCSSQQQQHHSNNGRRNHTHKNGHHHQQQIIRVVARRPVCYDMETARLAFFGGLGVNIRDYDYFVYVNCGLTGPGLAVVHQSPPPQQQPVSPTITVATTSPAENTISNATTTIQPQQPPQQSQPWTTAFTSLLTDTIKMAGLSINMFGVGGVPAPHIQSFLYVLDRVGIDIIQKSGAIYDCLVEKPDPNTPSQSQPSQPKSRRKRHSQPEPPFEPQSMREYLIIRYEMGMGRAILEAGYGMAPYLQPHPECTSVHHTETKKKCQLKDMWFENDLRQIYGGRLPFLNETLFFKTSRLLPDHIANDLNYTSATSSPKR